MHRVTRAGWLATAACLLATSASAGSYSGSTSSAIEAFPVAQPIAVSGHGSCTADAFCDVNQDTAALFTTQNSMPTLTDGTLFFGTLDAATSVRPAGSGVPEPAPTLLALAGLAQPLLRRAITRLRS